MTKQITNIKETLTKQEEAMTNIQKEVETIAEIRRRLENLEKKAKEKKTYTTAVLEEKEDEK